MEGMRKEGWLHQLPWCSGDWQGVCYYYSKLLEETPQIKQFWLLLCLIRAGKETFPVPFSIICKQEHFIKTPLTLM